MPASELLISADGHALVEHEQVKTHLAKKYHEAYDEAANAYAARATTRTVSNNQAWKSDRWIEEAADEEETEFRLRNWNRAGHTDGKSRLADMDTDGLQAEVLYCEVSAYRYLYAMREGAYDGLRAFNDTMTEFAAPDPSRLIMSYQIPINDIEHAIKEVRRVAALGGKSLQLPVFPAELGLPDYYHERYDPLLAAIQETGLPICCHVGLNTSLEDLFQRDPTPGGVVGMPQIALSTGEALGFWITAGVLERFPELKLVFVEPGPGWVAWWLYMADDLTGRQGYKVPQIKEPPSFYFHRQVSVTFIDEPDLVQSEHLRYRLGVENIMWSSDYPHPVTSFPNSHKIVDEVFAGVPGAERELMVSGNAKRVWNL
jgi:predicted TIM-barrel fold metal-dependent hydrolase